MTSELPPCPLSIHCFLRCSNYSESEPKWKGKVEFPSAIQFSKTIRREKPWAPALILIGCWILANPFLSQSLSVLISKSQKWIKKFSNFVVCPLAFTVQLFRGIAFDSRPVPLPCVCVPQGRLISFFGLYSLSTSHHAGRAQHRDSQSFGHLPPWIPSGNKDPHLFPDISPRVVEGCLKPAVQKYICTQISIRLSYTDCFNSKSP